MLSSMRNCITRRYKEILELLRGYAFHTQGTYEQKYFIPELLTRKCVSCIWFYGMHSMVCTVWYAQYGMHCIPELQQHQPPYWLPDKSPLAGHVSSSQLKFQIQLEKHFFTDTPSPICSICFWVKTSASFLPSPIFASSICQSTTSTWAVQHFYKILSSEDPLHIFISSDMLIQKMFSHPAIVSEKRN